MGNDGIDLEGRTVVNNGRKRRLSLFSRKYRASKEGHHQGVYDNTSCRNRAENPNLAAARNGLRR